MKLLNLVGIVAIFSACESTGGIISISIPLTGDECGVADATAVVTAPDISEVIDESMNVKDFTYMSALITDVPLGYDRLVTVTAYNSTARVVYAGAAYVDITVQAVPGQQGTPVPLDMRLYRNFVNCPNTGVICLDPPCYGQVAVNASISNSAPSDGGSP